VCDGEEEMMPTQLDNASVSVARETELTDRRFVRLNAHTKGVAKASSHEK
jgi:hypothetical protein